MFDFKNWKICKHDVHSVPHFGIKQDASELNIYHVIGTKGNHCKFCICACMEKSVLCSVAILQLCTNCQVAQAKESDVPSL